MNFDKALNIIDILLAGGFVYEEELIWLRSAIEEYEYFSKYHQLQSLTEEGN